MSTIIEQALISQGKMTFTSEQVTGTRAIFGFGAISNNSTGIPTNITNIVSRFGSVLNNQSALTGTARIAVAGAPFGENNVMFGFGRTIGKPVNTTNNVNDQGVVANDVNYLNSNVVNRAYSAGAGYDINKGIFIGGQSLSGSLYPTNILNVNMISAVGVLSNDDNKLSGTNVSGMGGIATKYGVDTAMYAMGYSAYDAITAYPVTLIGSLEFYTVSNTGIISDVQTNASVSARAYASAAPFGDGKAIIGFGGYNTSSGYVNSCNYTNIISNTGTISADITNLSSTNRGGQAAANLNWDCAIFAFGSSFPYTKASSTNNTNVTTYINNQGVAASDQVILTGTPRYSLAAGTIGI